jgi:hypothetical protein
MELVTARHFNPGPGVSKSALNVVPYVKDALAEVGLLVSRHLYGSTTDGGGEIRKLCTTDLGRSTVDMEVDDSDSEDSGMGESDEEEGEEEQQLQSRAGGRQTTLTEPQGGATSASEGRQGAAATVTLEGEEDEEEEPESEPLVDLDDPVCLGDTLTAYLMYEGRP